MEKTISFDSFNPYSWKFPEKKLVTKGTLELKNQLFISDFQFCDYCVYLIFISNYDKTNASITKNNKIPRRK